MPSKTAVTHELVYVFYAEDNGSPLFIQYYVHKDD